MHRDPRLIIALDCRTAREALAFCECLDPQRCAVKVGPLLLLREGLEVVRRLVRLGFRVFLDLKWHDIPRVAAGACAAAADLGVWMVNVHALGGPTMLEAARAALPEGQQERPLLVAVTVLTSLDGPRFRRLGWRGDIADQVLLLAAMAQDSGLDGVVCSAQEAPCLRTACGPDFLLVSPGIRPARSGHDDQSRIATPKNAVLNGVDYLVVGRAVTGAADPSAALRDIEREIDRALAALPDGAP